MQRWQSKSESAHFEKKKKRKRKRLTLFWRCGVKCDLRSMHIGPLGDYLKVIDYHVNIFLLRSQTQSKLEQLQWSEAYTAGPPGWQCDSTSNNTLSLSLALSRCPCLIQIIPGRLSEPRTGQPIPLLPSARQWGPPGRPHLQHRQIPQQAVQLPSWPFFPPGRRRHHRRGDPVRRQTRAQGDPSGFSRQCCRRSRLHFPAAPARTET